jgi:hypothetical protein
LFIVLGPGAVLNEFIVSTAFGDVDYSSNVG